MNHTLKAVKKCFGCRCIREEEEFIYGDKINKTCVKCRDKRKKNREPKSNKTNTTKNDDLTRYIRHQKFFRKINNEFLDRAAKPRHMYQMRRVFVDIRDCLIYSDKDFTRTNY